MFLVVMLLFAICSVFLTFVNIAADADFVVCVVLPTCFAIMTFSAAMYSVKHKNNKRLQWFIYYLMSMSMVYATRFLQEAFWPFVHQVSVLVGLYVLIRFLSLIVARKADYTMLLVVACFVPVKPSCKVARLCGGYLLHGYTALFRRWVCDLEGSDST